MKSPNIKQTMKYDGILAQGIHIECYIGRWLASGTSLAVLKWLPLSPSWPRIVSLELTYKQSGSPCTEECCSLLMWHPYSFRNS